MNTSSLTPREIWRVGDLVLDEGQQRVARGDEVIALPKLSFDLLLVLVRDAPNVVPIDSLLSRVWPDSVVNPETVVQRVKLLRDALDDRAAEPRYIAAVRGRGYRLVVEAVSIDPTQVARHSPAASDNAVPLAQASPGAAAAPIAESSSRHDATMPADRESRRRVMHRWGAAALALVALVLVLGVWSVQHRGSPAAPAMIDADDPALRTVAVLPFQNLSHDSADAAIALGVPDIVLDRLSSVQGLTVVARESAFRAFEASSDPIDVGRRLHAAFLVDGTIQRSGTMLRVTAKLIDARTQHQLWSTRYDRPVEDLFAIQDGIAEQVAAALNNRISGVRAPAAAEVPTHDVEAYLAWLRGRSLIGRYTAAKADAAAAEFEQAIARDPGFAAAYAALYDARMQAASLRFEETDTARRRNRPLLDRALTLDPDSSEVLFARAMWEDIDDVTREATFRAAVQRDPNNSRGLTAFAGFLELISNRVSAAKLRGQGLFPPHYGPPLPRGDARDLEATRLLERAITIDPLSAPARFQQFDRASSGRESVELMMREFLTVHPDYYPALHRLARYRWLFHDSPSQAIALIEKAIAADPQNPLARKSAATFYLDIGDAAAAADVSAGTTISAATAAPSLQLYAGNWRAAGMAAQREESFTFDVFEAHGSPEALRDMALHTHSYASAEGLLCTRYAMSLEGPVRVDLSNFRTWVLLAHLQLMQGHTERARNVLESVIAWIDADRTYGPVYNLRTRAQSLMLLGRRVDALRDLAASFHVDHDHVEWWYTIERDPIWDDVRDSPEFRALVADATRFASGERAAVEALRKHGEIPQRPSSAQAVVDGD
jgi:TolB-like protein/DNA-binding winged helix-turn-helix (wHTH) protein/Tfp pilus assembly protein PilF